MFHRKKIEGSGFDWIGFLYDLWWFHFFRKALFLIFFDISWNIFEVISLIKYTVFHHLNHTFSYNLSLFKPKSGKFICLFTRLVFWAGTALLSFIPYIASRVAPRRDETGCQRNWLKHNTRPTFCAGCSAKYSLSGPNHGSFQCWGERDGYKVTRGRDPNGISCMVPSSKDHISNKKVHLHCGTLSSSAVVGMVFFYLRWFKVKHHRVRPLVSDWLRWMDWISRVAWCHVMNSRVRVIQSWIQFIPKSENLV